MISAFDCDSYNKPGFDFGIAYSQGYRAGYIKLGGDNDGRYVGSSGPGYQGQFNRFCDAGFEHRGSYWVTGGDDPAGSARFYLAHRDPRTTFDVLDNESLDSGRKWSDVEACEFFDVLIAAGLKDLWQYGSRDSLWNTHAWPGLESRGIKAIVAIYNGSPFTNIYPGTYPHALVQGHQFTSSASIGGLGAIDENAFADDAFAGVEPKKDEEDIVAHLYRNTKTNELWAINPETGFEWYVPNQGYKGYTVSLKLVDSDAEINVSDNEFGLVRQWASINKPNGSVDADAIAKATAALIPAPVPVDYAALAAAIVKNGGTAPTADQIAKAVNDDAAARLKS